jgi:hypothetical protein
VLARQPSASPPRFDSISETEADFDRAVELPQDVDLLWAKINLAPSLQGRAMTILASARERSAWRHPFQVTLNRLEVPVQSAAEAAVINGWGAPQGFPGTAVSEGQCFVDNISAHKSSAQEAAVSGSFLRLTGWYVPWQKEASPEAIVLGFAAPDGDERFAAASIEKRPDVGKYFGRPELVDVGFSATLDISGVSFPSEMRIYGQRNGKISVCPFRMHLTHSECSPRWRSERKSCSHAAIDAGILAGGGHGQSAEVVRPTLGVTGAFGGVGNAGVGHAQKSAAVAVDEVDLDQARPRRHQFVPLPTEAVGKPMDRDDLPELSARGAAGPSAYVLDQIESARVDLGRRLGAHPA